MFHPLVFHVFPFAGKKQIDVTERGAEVCGAWGFGDSDRGPATGPGTHGGVLL